MHEHEEAEHRHGTTWHTDTAIRIVSTSQHSVDTAGHTQKHGAQHREERHQTTAERETTEKAETTGMIRTLTRKQTQGKRTD